MAKKINDLIPKIGGKNSVKSEKKEVKNNNDIDDIIRKRAIKIESQLNISDKIEKNVEPIVIKQPMVNNDNDKSWLEDSHDLLSMRVSELEEILAERNIKITELEEMLYNTQQNQISNRTSDIMINGSYDDIVNKLTELYLELKSADPLRAGQMRVQVVYLIDRLERDFYFLIGTNRIVQ